MILYFTKRLNNKSFVIVFKKILANKLFFNYNLDEYKSRLLSVRILKT